MSSVMIAVKELEALIKASYGRGDVRKCAEGVVEVTSDDVGEDLLLAFRYVMKTVEHDEQVKLLKFGTDLALFLTADGYLGASRIPYEIIETFLDGRSVAEIGSLWTGVEALLDKLMNPLIFKAKQHQNSLRVLKFCNKLLRRLSKTCHTELLGRVLFFLASIFPVSERSAVNVTGRVNTANTTTLEAAEEFGRNAGVEPSTSPTSGDGDEEEEEETSDLKGKDKDKAKSKGKGKGKVTASVDGIEFSTYEMFWGLQNCLSRDPKTLSSVAEWNKLMRHADIVLKALEQAPYSDLTLKQESAKWEAARGQALRRIHGDVDVHSQGRCDDSEMDMDGSDMFMGTKYLTSSKLLKLQIQDPLVRQQLCTQLLILTHNIRARPPSLVQATSDAGDAGVDKAKVDKIRKKLKKNAETERNQKVRATWKRVRGDLEKLEKRVYALVLKTPPNGKDLAATLQRLVERENLWVRWKVYQDCKPFEKPRTTELAKVSSAPSSSASSARLSSIDAGVLRDQCARYHSDVTLESAVGMVEDLRKESKSYEDHIELYIDAENPEESGIEEQYHPKHDPIYCWRARRLMQSKYLAVFGDMLDGNIATGLGRIRAIEEGSTEHRDLVFTIGEDESDEESDEDRTDAGMGDDEEEEGEVREDEDVDEDENEDGDGNEMNEEGENEEEIAENNDEEEEEAAAENADEGPSAEDVMAVNAAAAATDKKVGGRGRKRKAK